jgi:hypothetical protein
VWATGLYIYSLINNTELRPGSINIPSKILSSFKIHITGSSYILILRHSLCKTRYPDLMDVHNTQSFVAKPASRFRLPMPVFSFPFQSLHDSVGKRLPGSQPDLKYVRHGRLLYSINLSPTLSDDEGRSGAR